MLRGLWILEGLFKDPGEKPLSRSSALGASRTSALVCSSRLPRCTALAEGVAVVDLDGCLTRRTAFVGPTPRRQRRLVQCLGLVRCLRIVLLFLWQRKRILNKGRDTESKENSLGFFGPNHKAGMKEAQRHSSFIFLGTVNHLLQ